MNNLRTGPQSAVFLLLLSTFCYPCQGQYLVDWSDVSGGGGTAAGQVYSISGTIGQADAGTMKGNVYTIQGGFQVVFPMAVGPTPTLSIEIQGNQVVISWQPITPGFHLESTEDLQTSIWLPQAGSSPVALPITKSAQFFRLKTGP